MKITVDYKVNKILLREKLDTTPEDEPWTVGASMNGHTIQAWYSSEIWYLTHENNLIRIAVTLIPEAQSPNSIPDLFLEYGIFGTISHIHSVSLIIRKTLFWPIIPMVQLLRDSITYSKVVIQTSRKATKFIPSLLLWWTL